MRFTYRGTIESAPQQPALGQGRIWCVASLWVLQSIQHECRLGELPHPGCFPAASGPVPYCRAGVSTDWPPRSKAKAVRRVPHPTAHLHLRVNPYSTETPRQQPGPLLRMLDTVIIHARASALQGTFHGRLFPEQLAAADHPAVAARHTLGHPADGLGGAGQGLLLHRRGTS